MRWLKRDMWKVGIALAGLLFLLVLMVWLPASSFGASEKTPGFAKPVSGTVQATPTVDLTVTAMAKEQLALQVKQLQNQLEDQNNWLANNSTALIAAAATVIVALFGILQWAITVRQAQDKESRDRDLERRQEIAAQEKEAKDRQAAQDKELRAQAEERFQAAVTTLGSDNEATQVGGAILLRSFLNPNDKEIYGRYYTQIFDLAVAYLHHSNTSRLSQDPDGLPLPPEDPNAPLPLTPLRKALIAAFKEAFPLARKRLGLKERGLENQALNASHIRLDNVFLVSSDLSYSWMEYASLSNALLIGANLGGARLFRANLKKAFLFDSDLSGAMLIGADLSEAWLEGANFEQADLTGADLSGVRSIEEALSLKDTDLRGAKGLTKEQLEACKAKGAIIDEDTTTDSSQSSFAPPTPSQSNNPQAPSAPPTQVNIPAPSTDGSSSTAAQPSAEP